MKTLIAILSLTAAFEANARSVLPPAPQFKECTSSDLNVLDVARSAAVEGVDDVVRNEVLPNVKTCVVSRPRYFHPAVCGAYISQVDTFRVTTAKAKVEFVVDSSYRSCLRIHVIPTITSFKFEALQDNIVLE